MFKHIKFAALALLLSAGFAACSDNDDPQPSPNPDPVLPVRGEAGMYVINQGNQDAKLASSIDFLSINGTANVSSMFQAANNQALGSTAQKPIIYGSKMYIPMYDNDLVWVADANTLKIVAKIETNEPEAVCGSEGYVFVNNNDGYVTRVDTTNFAKSQIEVGPNPASLGITAYEGKVYVSISDGYNYPSCANGKKVAVIDAKTFTKEKDIAVGLNPGQITTDAFGNVFVVCMGNYGDVAPEVWKIDRATSVASKFCNGSFIATRGAQDRGSRAQAAEDALYVINSVTDYNTYVTTLTSAVYSTTTGAVVLESFLPSDNLPVSATAIDINPSTGDVYVCSDAAQFDYTSPGYINVYNANGTFLRRLSAGVHPYGVVFK